MVCTHDTQKFYLSVTNYINLILANDDVAAKEFIESYFDSEDKENHGQSTSTSLTTGSKDKNIYATKKSAVLSARKRNLTSDKWQELAEEKCKLVRLQQKQSEERYTLEIMHMNEEHEKKMLLLDAELEKLKKELSKN